MERRIEPGAPPASKRLDRLRDGHRACHTPRRLSERRIRSRWRVNYRTATHRGGRGRLPLWAGERSWAGDLAGDADPGAARAVQPLQSALRLRRRARTAGYARNLACARSESLGAGAGLARPDGIALDGESRTLAL